MDEGRLGRAWQSRALTVICEVAKTFPGILCHGGELRITLELLCMVGGARRPAHSLAGGIQVLGGVILGWPQGGLPHPTKCGEQPSVCMMSYPPIAERKARDSTGTMSS